MKTNAIATVRLLIVSPGSAVLHPIWSIGKSNCWQVEMAANAWEAMDKIQSGVSLDLLLLDLPQRNGEALHALRWLRRFRPALPIILIGHAGDAGTKQESLRLGASDYLIRPLEDHQLETAIQRNLSVVCDATETDISSDDVEMIGNCRFFVGTSFVMRKLRTQAALLAEADVPVLILGEEGSGKETIARLIHQLSVRKGFGFAKVACAALPGDLLEKELLGYERKEKTASAQSKSGKLEFCAKGTILLDEIIEMPLRMQSNLLDALQKKRFIRPGTSNVIEADVRVMAASSTDLEHAVSEDRFDEDLYNYLTAYMIHIPPLRERKAEIPFLARHFMRRLATQYGLAPREYSPAILANWSAYNWPGNLLELECFVKRYLMVGAKELAFDQCRCDFRGGSPCVVPSRLRGINQAAPLPIQSSAVVSEPKSLRFLVQSVRFEAEKNAIAEALEKTGWNRKAAARLLNVSYRTVLYKIEQYKMIAYDTSRHTNGNGNGKGPSSVGTSAGASGPEKVANP